MAEDIVIRAEQVGKKYIIGHQSERERYITLRDVLARMAQNAWRKTLPMARGQAIVAGDTTEEFWALKDVNFEVKRGEVLGIIGRNGAGKSTLLKILSRITELTEGRITIAGRVASLLEVGTGFHPELTGKENIYLNGAIIGMTRAEIRKKFDEIVAFSEVERFLDTPVKRYSSGMCVRLAFAVAAHLEPEILVVDEVLAVGDLSFQKKCLGKMSEVASGGRTVLFVSHNIGAIQALCSRCLYLASGTLANDGSTANVIPLYLSEIRTNGNKLSDKKLDDGLILEKVVCTPDIVASGSSLRIDMSLRADQPEIIRECALLIFSSLGVRVGIVDLRDTGAMPYRFTEGHASIKIEIQNVAFIEGSYTIGLFLATNHFADDLLNLAQFSVTEHQSQRYTRYSPEHRGVVVVKAQSLITNPQLASSEMCESISAAS